MSSTVRERMLYMPASRRVAITFSWSLLIMAAVTYRSGKVLLMVISTALALALTIAIVVTLYIILGWGERDAQNRKWWAAQRGRTPQ